LRVEFHSVTPYSRSHDEPNSVQGLVIRYTPIVMASFVAAACMYRLRVAHRTVAFEGSEESGNWTIERLQTFAPQNPTTRSGSPP